jgi:hypothetical protein
MGECLPSVMGPLVRLARQQLPAGLPIGGWLLRPNSHLGAAGDDEPVAGQAVVPGSRTASPGHAGRPGPLTLYRRDRLRPAAVGCQILITSA